MRKQNIQMQLLLWTKLLILIMYYMHENKCYKPTSFTLRLCYLCRVETLTTIVVLSLHESPHLKIIFCNIFNKRPQV